MLLPASNQQLLQSQGVVSFTVFSGMRKVLNRKSESEQAGAVKPCAYGPLSNIVDASVEASMMLFEVTDYSSPYTDEQYPFAEVVLNGIDTGVDITKYKTMSPAQKQACMAKFESKIRYLGFASNTTIVRPEAPMLMSHNVSQCGGTRSVLNTGPFPIRAGQLIMARVPDFERTDPQTPRDNSWNRSPSTRFPELIAIENNDRLPLSRAHIAMLLKNRAVGEMVQMVQKVRGSSEDELDDNSLIALNKGMMRIATLVLTTLTSQIQGVALNGCEQNQWFDLHITGPSVNNMLLNEMLTDNWDINKE